MIVVHTYEGIMKLAGPMAQLPTAQTSKIVPRRHLLVHVWNAIVIESVAINQ